MEQNNEILWLRSDSKSAEDMKIESISADSQFGSLAKEQSFSATSLSLMHSLN